LGLFQDETYQEYINSLRNEIESRDNTDELKKRILLSDDGSMFIESVMSSEEHQKLIQELGEDGIWFHPLSTAEEIRRILNPSSCADILLFKRADYIADHARTRRVFLKRKKIYEQNGKDFSLTNYYKEDKLFAKYLNILKPQIKQSCKKVEAGFVFATEPNGICERTEFGNIIYLSESLSYFLHFMNFSFINYSHLGIHFDASEINESLLIATRVMLGVEALDFDLDPRYDSIPPDAIHNNIRLVEQQLMFIIGHEYAHHSLKHLANSKLTVLQSNQVFKTTNTTVPKFYNYSQKQEFEADWYAFKNTKLKKEEKEEMLNAAFLFFIYLDIHKHVQDYLNPSCLHYKTHPDPLDRLWNLRKKIPNGIGATTAELKEKIQSANGLKKILSLQLPYNIELFENSGSIYISKYKSKKLVDRIDY
jgi:hypothetical protein